MAETGQQHPISIYFWIWGLLFVFSAASYTVDYVGFQGYTRWSLIIIFMMMKAGFIVSIFMHMRWERVALITAILMPPGALLVLVSLMAYESDYTWASRVLYLGAEMAPEALPPSH